MSDAKLLHRIDVMSREISVLRHSEQGLLGLETSVCTAGPGRYGKFEFIVFNLPDEFPPELPLDLCLRRIADSYGRGAATSRTD